MKSNSAGMSLTNEGDSLRLETITLQFNHLRTLGSLRNYARSLSL